MVFSMTKDKSIFIKNIYYMLSYAFQVLRQSNYDEVSTEDFDHAEDLFAAILARGISRQLKQGLYRTYITKQETLSVMRGKLDMPGTIKNRIQRKTKLDCIFDELSENNTYNQILKTTAQYLLRAESVDPERKGALKKVLVFFDGIDILEPSTIQWGRLHYQRNNRNYELLMNICYFVLDGMLQTTESGEYRVASFSDEHMARLYEKFILEYYREHHTYLSEVKAAQVKWDITGDTSAPLIRFLPAMQTDITLRLDERVLIIDAKYYGKTLQQQFDKYTLHSGNVYQIYTYVKNLDAKHTGNVGGLLLYAKTDEDVTPDGVVEIGNNMIDPETFEMVQRELARRTKGKNRHSGVHLLSGRIKCGDCGGWYGSKVWHSPEKCKRTIWQCNQKYKNEVRCTTPYLDKASVKERFTVAVNQLLAGRDAAIAAYEMGMARTLDTTELEAQQQELLSEMEILNGMIQQMIRQNATVAQDQTEYNQRFDSLSQKFKEAESKKDAVAQQISDIRDRRGTMEDFLRILKQQDGEVTTFSEKLWCGLLDYATAYADGRLTFTFKNGSTFEG